MDERSTRRTQIENTESVISVGETRIYPFPDRNFDQSKISIKEQDGYVNIDTPGLPEEVIQGKIVHTPSGEKVIVHFDKPNYLGYAFVQDVFHLGKKPTAEEALHEDAHRRYYRMSQEQQTKLNSLIIGDPELLQMLLDFADAFYMDKGLGYIPTHFLKFALRYPDILNTFFTSEDNEPGLKDKRVIRINDTGTGIQREVILSLLISELLSHMSARAGLGIESQYSGSSEERAKYFWTNIQDRELLSIIRDDIFAGAEDGFANELINAFDVQQ